MKFKVIFLFAAVYCLGMVLPVLGGSVETNFDPNKAFTRYSMPLSGSLFYSDPRGYLRCSVQRKTGTATAPCLGDYYLPLGKKYYVAKDVNETNVQADYYVGFDFWYDPNTYGVAAAQIGLFNSDSNNVSAASFQLNSVAITPLGITAGDGFSIESQYNVLGTGEYNQTSYVVNEFTISRAASYRCRMHIKSTGGQAFVDFDVNSIDAFGNEANVGAATNILIADNVKQSAGMNALGIRNSYGSANSNPSIFRIDNMYFSTTGFKAMGVPSWLVSNNPSNFLAGSVKYSTGFRPWPDVNHPSGNGVWYIKGGAGTGIHNDVNDFDSSGVLYGPDGYPDENGKGYGYTRIRRKSEWDYSAAIYQPLDQRYFLPFNDGAGYSLQTTNEFWMGLDWRWCGGNTSIQYVFGLFNKDSVNSATPSPGIYDYQNHIGLAIYGNTVDLCIRGNSDWGKQYPTGSGSNPDSFNLGYLTDMTFKSWYRIKFHYYMNAGTPTVNVQAYKFDGAGVLGTTPDMEATYPITDTAIKFYEGMNAFGIRNARTGTLGSNTYNNINFDNAYFSTIGPMDLERPSAFALNKADGNVDGKVDFKDFASFAKDWNSTTNLFWDMTNTTAPELWNGKIDFNDLAIFVNYWLAN